MLQIVKHAVLESTLGVIRNRNSTVAEFRAALRRAGDILAIYALQDVPASPQIIQTPLVECQVNMISEEEIVVVPILRAGLAFVESFIRAVPGVIVGHIGLARDHVTLESRQYFEKLPPGLDKKTVFILDPMLATGNSAFAAYQRLREAGVNKCTIVSLLAAPEGVKYLTDKAPELKIICAHLDERLNEKSYIVPGLGDAGDRFFGV